MMKIFQIPVETFNGKPEWIFGRKKVDIINVRKIINRIPKKNLVSNDDECIGVLIIKNGRVKKVVVLSQGQRYTASVNLKDLFKVVLLEDASDIVMFHTHPRDNSKPSVHDLEFTNAVKHIAHSLSIGFLDHFILGIDKTLSMVEEGYI